MRCFYLRVFLLCGALALAFSSASAAEYQRQVLVSGIQRPVFVCQAPGDNDRLFILEQQTGRIIIFKYSTNSVNASPFLNANAGLATGNEQGLLGLAFHPNYQTNHQFFIYRTLAVGTSGNDYQVIERYTCSADPDTANAGGVNLMYFPVSASNHNAGWLGFGPDGFLYCSTGDGGGDDQHGTFGWSQDRTTPFGKILRFDVNSTSGVNIQSASWSGGVMTVTTASAHNFCTGQTIAITGASPAAYNVAVAAFITVTGANTFTFALAANPGTYASGGVCTPAYRVPATNPYATHATFRREIWAFGLRNPWRCSFDRSTGDLWIGDVGQNTREEVDVLPHNATAPLNFGWRVREGLIQNPAYPSETTVTAATDPVFDYGHGVGVAVIGGYRYRGTAIPTLQGHYFFSDDGSSKVWSFTYNGTAIANFTDRTADFNAGNNALSGVTAFGEDNAGEIYICDLAGTVSKIVPALQITTASPLPQWTMGKAGFSQSFSAINGTAPYTWSLKSGSTLPTGLTLSSAGVLSGTPTVAGIFSFTLSVKDSLLVTTSKAFSITINPALAITTTTPLPQGNVGQSYSQSFAATGGTGGPAAQTWTISSGTPPGGLTLSSAGVLSGTLTASGTFNFTVLVTDGVGATASKAVAVTINGTLTVATVSLPAWTSGHAYAQSVSAVGGKLSYTWSITAGALPAGLSLSTAGAITGTPTTPGTANFTVQVKDSLNATDSKALSITINAPPSIDTASPLPDGIIGNAYTQALTASNGTPTLTWSVFAGALPTGVTLSSAGSVNGTPTVSGTFNFTAKVLDAAGASTTKAFVLTISAAPTVTSTANTHGNIGVPYSYQVTATGNPAPTFTLVGTPPTGMSINATSGMISWEPDTAGSFDVSVKAGNGTAPDAQQDFTIVVTDYGLDVRPSAKAYLNMPHTEAGTMPALLSQTGAFANTANLIPAPALIAYDVNSPLWSDGATKFRWIAVPTGQQIGFGAQGNYTFPPGTVLVKHFELGTDENNPAVRKRLETRLLVIKADGSAYGVTYHWRANNLDADLLPGTLSENITIQQAGGGTRTQTWTYPSRTDCLSCHTPQAGRVLGVRTNQLNGIRTYTETGVTDNQIRTWNHIGLFNTNVNEASIPGFDKLVKITDTSATLDLRVRSYWASNCMQCHQPTGAPSTFDARFETPLASQHVIGEVPSAGNLGIDNAKIVKGQDIYRSLMHLRMNTNQSGVRMPPVGRNTVDSAAVAVLEEWINSLPGNPTLAPPQFSPNGGAFAGQVVVALSSDDPLAEVRYTLDGSDPDGTSLLYTSAVTLYKNTTLTARAFRSGYDNSIAAAAVFTVADMPPTISVAAQAAPATVQGTFTDLSVTGLDDTGEPNLTYTWAATGPAAVSFTNGTNGTNGAKNLRANFAKLGAYSFTVTLADPGGMTKTSAKVAVTVVQGLTSITLTPPSATLNKNANQQFSATANDQFGAPFMKPPVFTWSAKGNGSVSPAGVFTAGQATAPASVSAAATVSGLTQNASANITILNQAPVLGSALRITPSPAITGGRVTFACPASDPDNDPLTFAWDFGDGQTGTGNPVTHIYAAANPSYAVQVQVSDGTTTLPQNGTAAVQDAGILNLSSVQLSLNFARSGMDSAAMAGVLPSMPANFTPKNAPLHLDLGGAGLDFTLDANGFAQTAQGSVKLTPSGSSYLFSATLTKGSWQSFWSDEGLTGGASVVNGARSINVTIQAGGNTYAATRSLLYTAVANLWGIAK